MILCVPGLERSITNNHMPLYKKKDLMTCTMNKDEDLCANPGGLIKVCPDHINSLTTIDENS